MTTTELLREKLKHPDKSRRPVQIIHSYFPKTTPELSAFLDTAEQNGLGGFVVNMDVVVPRRPEAEESEEDYRSRSLDAYLGAGTPETEAAWDGLRRFIDACFARGFAVWIYDERAYPSGAAGRRVLEGHPEDQVKGLVCQTRTAGAGKGRMERETGTLRFAAAYPVRDDGVVDTAVRFPVEQTETDVCWDLPERYRTYRICAFYIRAVSFLTENKVPYVDLMRADVTDRFLEVTHEAYLRRLGEERIRKITAFFTDEPGLPTQGCSSYFHEKNAVAAWTEPMEKLLPNDWTEHCVDLFFDTTGDFAARRRQYWQCAARLFGENYFGRIADWCERHGTRMTGHLYGEETLSMQIGLNADLFGHLRRMQMPGVDRLYAAEPRDVTAEKTASSAAHLTGQPFTMSESSFHLEYNWWKTPEQATPENRLNSAYYQMQLGISHLASYYAYGSSYDKERLEFEEQAARASIFCGTGTHSTDVLVLIPMNAAYERFTPQDHKYWDVGPCIVAPHQPKPVQILEKAYGTVLELLENDKLDFDLIDEAGLTGCTVDDGGIATGYECFRTLVLFDSAEPEPETARWIQHFLEKNGKIVVVETDRKTKFCAELLRTFPRQVLRTAETEITEACRKSGAEPLLPLAEACPNVRIRRTYTADADLWFLHNRADETTLTVCDSGDYTIFSVDGCETHVKSDGSFPLSLPQKSAVMLVRQKERQNHEIQ
ncbi:MAG: hypothetical protein ACI4V1_05885, partial [Eubacteriales bacterium]